MNSLKEIIINYVAKNGPCNSQQIWIGISNSRADKMRVYQGVSLLKRLGVLSRDPIGRYTVPDAPAKRIAEPPIPAKKDDLDDLFPATPAPTIDLSAIRDAANPILSLLDEDQPAIVNKIPQHGLICAWLSLSDIEALRDALKAS